MDVKMLEEAIKEITCNISTNIDCNNVHIISTLLAVEDTTEPLVSVLGNIGSVHPLLMLEDTYEEFKAIHNTLKTRKCISEDYVKRIKSMPAAFGGMSNVTLL